MEAIVTIQARDNGGVTWDSGNTVNKTWSHYACILKVKSTGLVDRLNVS